ncbi:hypothetical protein [Fructilactobacillus cliffordii]|uniref:RamC N-terminal domain-containing protein n=1 Tax=Fructilactobacillus cliffordii TaxID=2940299 RepID=A0A9Q8ZT63_9LACO|nr:hypothetical protein [Fructilactobacillus cliffordii]USS88878.1 hypothetical protein M3M40_05175 [Fructilactobacillus cliffordii]
MITNYLIDNNRYNKEVGIYRNVMFENYDYPDYGWKIHISSSRKDLNKVLLIVSEYCFNNKINFKYIFKYAEFAKNISCDEKCQNSGKFITIYPYNEETAQKILEDLSKLLIGTNGPLILNDFQYKFSNNVFFRFGFLKYTGSYNIKGPNGDIFRDFDYYVPRLPSWIKVPKGWISEKINPPLVTKYHPSAIIRRSNSGNVYIGKMDDSTEVIIKEARKHIEVYKNMNVTSFKENGWKFSNRFSSFTEQPIDKIEEQHSIFYIYKKINGISLTNYVGLNSFVLGNTVNKRQDLFNDEKSIIHKIYKLINLFHENNMVNIDIHPDNIFVTNNGNIKFIDMETVNIFNYQIRTPQYWDNNMKNDSNQIQDLRRFGFLVMFLLGQANKYHNSLNIIKMIDLTEQLLKPFGEICFLKKVLYELLYNSVPDKKKINLYLDSMHLNNNHENIEKNCTFQSDFKLIILRAIRSLIYSNPDDIICFLDDVFNKNLHSLNQIKDFLNEKIKDISKLNTGFSGIGGLLAICSINEVFFNDFIKLINKEIICRIVKERGNLYVLVNNDDGYIDPYLSDGMSGFLLSQTLISKKKWIKETKDLCKSLCVPYAKTFDYLNGLLGITDMLLAISIKASDYDTRKVGLENLYQINKIKNICGGNIPLIKRDERYEFLNIDNFNAMVCEWNLNI